MSSIGKSLLRTVIELTRSSEIKFKQGDFKGAIDQRKKVKSILNSKSVGIKFVEKFREELSNLYNSKFDLIYDHKLKIDKIKIDQIVKLLEKKSEEKYKKGDFKGAIKALRRSEKYLAK